MSLTLLNYHIDGNDYPSTVLYIQTVGQHLNQLKKTLNTIEPGRFGPPLWIATSKGFVDIARLLLQWGADVNWSSPSTHMTCLHCACDRLDKEMVQLLVEYGADTTCKLLYSPHTPLDLAHSATLSLLARCMYLRTIDTKKDQIQFIEHLHAIKELVMMEETRSSFPSTTHIENQP